MSCPDIDRLLEDPRALGSHVDGCEACRGVSALLDLRHERIAGADDACERAELAIALLHEGLLSELERVALTQHLETCSACNETAARVLSLPAYDARPRVALPERGYWRPLAIGLGATTLLASAAAVALFFARPRTETTVAAVPERVQIIERRAEPGGAVSPVVPSPEPPPVITAPPKIDFPLPVPTPPRDPFVGRQTNDEVMNPWADTGFLSVVCSPTCDSISVKGKKLGPSPVVRAVLPVGSHTVSLRRGRHSRARVVEIKKGETTTVRVHMNMDVGF